jgi:predicted ATPase
VSVSSGTAGTYTNTIAASALTSAQKTSNTAAVSGSLTVTASSHGGGALDWMDLTFFAGVLLAGRRRFAHRRAGRAVKPRHTAATLLPSGSRT